MHTDPDHVSPEHVLTTCSFSLSGRSLHLKNQNTTAYTCQGTGPIQCSTSSSSCVASTPREDSGLVLESTPKHTKQLTSSHYSIGLARGPPRILSQVFHDRVLRRSSAGRDGCAPGFPTSARGSCLSVSTQHRHSHQHRHVHDNVPLKALRVTLPAEAGLIHGWLTSEREPRSEAPPRNTAIAGRTSPVARYR